MKAHYYRALPLTCLLFLAACGDSVSTPMSPITPTPTPAPTPTPTPTPAASTYQPVADFSRDRTFSGLIIADTTQVIPPALVYRNPDATVFSYTAGTQTFTAFGQTLTPGVNNTTLVQTDNTLVYNYLIATSGCTLTIYRKFGGATYVGYVTNFQGVKPLSLTSYALIGAPTTVSDLPLSGTTTFEMTAGEIGTTAAGQTLTFDAATHRVSGTVTLTLTGGTAPVSVTFQGAVDQQSGRVDGTITTATGAYTGAVHGRLYGPGATEMGLIFDLKDSPGNDLPGILIGHR